MTSSSIPPKGNLVRSHTQNDMLAPVKRRLRQIMCALSQPICDGCTCGSPSADGICPFEWNARRLIAAAQRLHNDDIDRIIFAIPKKVNNKKDFQELLLSIQILIEAIEDVFEQTEILARQSNVPSSEGTSAAVETSSDATGDPFDPREEHSLRLMIIATALRFGYRGTDDRGRSVTAIQTNIHKLGRTLDPKTIRTHLDEASKLVDTDLLKDF